jgi:uncharacterized membrane protein YkvA (DUF1232 family)
MTEQGTLQHPLCILTLTEGSFMNKNFVESFYSWYRGALAHPKYRWLIILGTAAYLISPIDLISDFPIIGWLDDGVLATLLVTELSSMAMAYFKKGKDEPTTTVADAEETIDVEAKIG